MERAPRSLFAYDPTIKRIALEMPVFKYVPVAWLSERWRVDVVTWLNNTPQETQQAFGVDSRIIGEQQCLIVVGPGSHASLSEVGTSARALVMVPHSHYVAGCMRGRLRRR